MPVFSKQIEKKLKGLTLRQVVFFAWLCAVRALPFLCAVRRLNGDVHRRLGAITWALDVARDIVVVDAVRDNERQMER